MSSIKSEVEVLRIFDCFDDGTAEWKGKARVRDNFPPFYEKAAMVVKSSVTLQAAHLLYL